jgi:hypothetical protein
MTLLRAGTRYDRTVKREEDMKYKWQPGPMPWGLSYLQLDNHELHQIGNDLKQMIAREFLECSLFKFRQRLTSVTGLLAASLTGVLNPQGFKKPVTEKSNIAMPRL